MKTMTYEPSAGTRIEHACAEAATMAKRGGATVRFKFNDVELVATPDREPDALVADWRRESDRLSEEYRNSPKGRSDAAAREAQITSLKSQAAELLSKLESVLAAKDSAGNDRFRLRRARLGAWGDLNDDFDFKIMGDLAQSDGINSGNGGTRTASVTGGYVA